MIVTRKLMPLEQSARHHLNGESRTGLAARRYRRVLLPFSVASSSSSSATLMRRFTIPGQLSDRAVYPAGSRTST